MKDNEIGKEVDYYKTLNITIRDFLLGNVLASFRHLVPKGFESHLIKTIWEDGGDVSTLFKKSLVNGSLPMVYDEKGEVIDAYNYYYLKRLYSILRRVSTIRELTGSEYDVVVHNAFNELLVALPIDALGLSKEYLRSLSRTVLGLLVPYDNKIHQQALEDLPKFGILKECLPVNSWYPFYYYWNMDKNINATPYNHIIDDGGKRTTPSDILNFSITMEVVRVTIASYLKMLSKKPPGEYNNAR